MSVNNLKASCRRCIWIFGYFESLTQQTKHSEAQWLYDLLRCPYLTLIRQQTSHGLNSLSYTWSITLPGLLLHLFLDYIFISSYGFSNILSLPGGSFILTKTCQKNRGHFSWTSWGHRMGLLAHRFLAGTWTRVHNLKWVNMSPRPVGGVSFYKKKTLTCDDLGILSVCLFRDFFFLSFQMWCLRRDDVMGRILHLRDILPPDPSLSSDHEKNIWQIQT